MDTPKIVLWDDVDKGLERLREIEIQVNELAIEARQILKAIAPQLSEKFEARMAAKILVH